MTRCPVRQHRVQINVDQLTNDGHLVFEPRSSNSRSHTIPLPIPSSPPTRSPTDSSTPVQLKSAAAGAGRPKADAAPRATSTAVDGSRHVPDNDYEGPQTSMLTYLVGGEDCPWIISAKPGN